MRRSGVRLPKAAPGQSPLVRSGASVRGATRGAESVLPGSMPRSGASTAGRRGEAETLPSGSLGVRVHAGIDPEVGADC